jgi:hypothetical protein
MLDAVSTLLPEFCRVPVKLAVVSPYLAKLDDEKVLSLISLPVTPSKAAKLLLIAEDGPVTSPDPVPDAPFSASVSQ